MSMCIYCDRFSLTFQVARPAMKGFTITPMKNITNNMRTVARVSLN